MSISAINNKQFQNSFFYYEYIVLEPTFYLPVSFPNRPTYLPDSQMICYEKDNDMSWPFVFVRYYHAVL